MIPILFESTETAFDNNGICRLRDILSATVCEERNGIYECEFEYPVDGINFNEIQCGRIILAKHEDSEDLQPFDIVSYEKPINGVVTFHAVHISYRLNSAPFRTATLGGTTYTAQDWMNYIRSVAGYDESNTGATIFGPYKQFSFYSDITGKATVPALLEKDHFLTLKQALGGIEGSILDTFHGEYLFDKFSVSLLKARGEEKDFSIRYGLNMTEYNDETDYSSSANSFMAYWSKDGVTRYAAENVLTPYNDRNDFVLYDFTETYETAPTSATLKTAGRNKLKAEKANLPAQTISISFVRLQDTPEYYDLSPLFQCKLCDSINVAFPRYGMTGKYKIVKAVWNVLLDRYDSMELGSLSTSLSEALGVSSDSSGGGSSAGITVDSAFSSSSENPVQNKVITNTLTVDYITETGTGTGAGAIWTYRKWKSGIKEVWGIYSASIAITTSSAAYGGYRSGSLNLPTFPITFTNAPTGTATAQSTGGFWVNNLTPTTNGGSFYLSCGQSQSASTRKIAFHFIGK